MLACNIIVVDYFSSPALDFRMGIWLPVLWPGLLLSLSRVDGKLLKAVPWLGPLACPCDSSSTGLIVRSQGFLRL